MRKAFAIARVSAFALWMAAMMLPLFLLHFFARALEPSFHRFYFRAMCLMFGMRVRCHGRLAGGARLLVVGNHASYLDIVAMGSRFKVNFIAKSDVADWPVFGMLSKLGNTIFISRNRMRAKSELGLMGGEFRRRRLPLVVFPEGTSSDGTLVLPFKSSLFSLFEGKDGRMAGGMMVQPVSIAYVAARGRRLDDAGRRVFGWPIEDTRSMMRHLVDVLEYAPFTVEIKVHEPIDAAGFGNRKELGAYCRSVVEDGFRKLIGKE
ncbi:MAG: 1-acyl-sn-glycerol-3-phosphate acyltransferase [Rickettsiales bacterium]|jgi:1-acyl-sn-glycerol-3-phosphate acyltransferase|nr:1-acyl-sn-glycerol-3-phosphate acyltransferase [Rickettsiales bacterium]